MTLSLPRDHALVLLEWLSREDGHAHLPTEHLSEGIVLEALGAQLARLVVERTEPGWADVLDEARSRVVFGGE